MASIPRALRSHARKYIVSHIREERNTEHSIESALHGQAFVQELWREERVAQSAFRSVNVKADKYTRALAWANRAEAGKVVLVAGSWINDFLSKRPTRRPGRRHQPGRPDDRKKEKRGRGGLGHYGAKTTLS